MSRETLNELSNAAHIFLRNNTKIDGLRDALDAHEKDEKPAPKRKRKETTTTTDEGTEEA